MTAWAVTLAAIPKLSGEAKRAAIRRLARLERDHALACGECDTCNENNAPDWRNEVEL